MFAQKIPDNKGLSWLVTTKHCSCMVGKHVYRDAWIESGNATSLIPVFTRLQNRLIYFLEKLRRIFHTLKTQIALLEKAYTNYYALQCCEEIRFQAEESTLFLINVRKTITLKNLQKLQELKAKFFKTKISLQWATGEIFQ